MWTILVGISPKDARGWQVSLYTHNCTHNFVHTFSPVQSALPCRFVHFVHFAQTVLSVRSAHPVHFVQSATSYTSSVLRILSFCTFPLLWLCVSLISYVFILQSVPAWLLCFLPFIWFLW